MVHECSSLLWSLCQPAVRELSWIEEFELLFGSWIIGFFLCQENVFQVKFLHIQELPRLLFNFLALFLGLLFAARGLIFSIGLLRFYFTSWVLSAFTRKFFFWLFFLLLRIWRLFLLHSILLLSLFFTVFLNFFISFFLLHFFYLNFSSIIRIILLLNLILCGFIILIFHFLGGDFLFRNWVLFSKLRISDVRIWASESLWRDECMADFFFELIVPLFTEMVPLIIQEDGALPEGQSQNV